MLYGKLLSGFIKSSAFETIYMRLLGTDSCEKITLLNAAGLRLPPLLKVYPLTCDNALTVHISHRAKIDINLNTPMQQPNTLWLCCNWFI